MDEILAKIDTMEKRLKDVELKVNEEQKGNDGMDKIMNEIESMKQDIHKLSNKNNGNNTERQKLKTWLDIVVGLGQYYDILIQNGIEDLYTTRLLTMDTIKAMGIDKIGHQIKLLNHIIQLKQNNNNEGSTPLIQ